MKYCLLLKLVLLHLAPSIPLNVMVALINATAVNVTWEEPVTDNGIIRSYLVSIYTNTDVVLTAINHTDVSVLTVNICGLTPNTMYTVNISAVTVEPGDVASMSFTTPSCKCVIVLMCYIMYCFD